LPRVRWCASFACSVRGLTFRRRLDDDEGLLLVGRGQGRLAAAIHMVFVFFPIAVVWLNREGLVVDVRLALPFRPLYVPREAAFSILEGPPRLLERVRPGDRLRFEG